MRALLQLIVGWRLWRFVRNDIRRFAVVCVGFLLITYLSHELETILVLKENNNLLVLLIISKNLAYLGLVITFFLWPFFRDKDAAKPIAGSGETRPPEKTSIDFDGYEFIRRRGRIRRKSEILDGLINANQKKEKGK
ncbi:MAG: hypothetical protein ACPGGG_08395 [Parvibaculales bacterium]